MFFISPDERGDPYRSNKKNRIKKYSFSELLWIFKVCNLSRDKKNANSGVGEGFGNSDVTCFKCRFQAIFQLLIWSTFLMIDFFCGVKLKSSKTFLMWNWSLNSKNGSRQLKIKSISGMTSSFRNLGKFG